MNNIVTASFLNSRETMTAPLYQYDYGISLQITGVELPQTFEAHFSNYELGESTTQIGTNGIVAIPDAYLLTGLPV